VRYLIPSIGGTESQILQKGIGVNEALFSRFKPNRHLPSVDPSDHAVAKARVTDSFSYQHDPNLIFTAVARCFPHFQNMPKGFAVTERSFYVCHPHH
jgi:hypothetical protein